MRQALNGPEEREWREARQKEYENLLRHEAFEPVPEDTLPTWDALKRRASEVVNILDVLKKKYVDNVFERFKARWVYDGRGQKAANASSASPFDTFAPTVRHSTHKACVGKACMDGAMPTRLSEPRASGGASSGNSGEEGQ